jgi:hypothetical protein
MPLNLAVAADAPQRAEDEDAQ